MVNMKILGIVLIAGLGIFVGIVLFRHYIPYASTMTNMLNIDESIPTIETVVSSVQVDPLGALKTGGIVTTAVGLVKVGVGKVQGFVEGVRTTKEQVSGVQNQLGSVYGDVTWNIAEVKTDLTKQITDTNTEISTLKTDLSTQVSSLKESAGDIQALKEDTAQINSVTQTNSEGIETLKTTIQNQQTQINTLIETLRAKSQDPLVSYG